MKYKMIYLWFGLPILIIILWFVAFYRPMASVTEDRRKELAAAQNSRHTVGAALRDMLDARRRDAGTRSSLRTSSRDIPLFNEFPGVIKAVAGTAKDQDLALEVISAIVPPNEPQASSMLAKPVLDMGLKGRFMNMGRFLEDIQGRKGFKRIAYARVSSSDQEYPVLMGRFLVEFRAWRRERAFENQ